MGGVDGVRQRRIGVTNEPLETVRATSDKTKPAATAPWNIDYDKVPSGIQQYDRALFSSPAVVVRAASPTSATAADEAWDAVKTAPMPMLGAASPPTCAPHLATGTNARSFADRGIPINVALERSLITTLPELERFIDDYIEYTATNPSLKGLHDDALRSGSEIVAKRLDTELAEEKKAADEAQLRDRVAPIQVRPPLPIQQRAAVGEVAIPVAKTITEVSKFVPIVGELVMAAEALAGKDIGGLGQDVERSERLLSGALLLTPFAVEALATGVRGAAQLFRLARATGKTTEETRNVLRAARTLKENENGLREAFAAKKAGRALTAEQTAVLRTTEESLAEIRGAAAQSRLDIHSSSGLRTFASNANGVARSLQEATAIARTQGVVIPSWIRIEVDPTIREAKSFAEYTLGRGEQGATSMLAWGDLAPDGVVVVRVHPNVLKSDEKIVGVLEHEIWELTQLRARVESHGMLSAEDVRRMIDPTRPTNLHGQAWDIADLRVLAMRETDPAKKAQLLDRLGERAAGYQKENLR